MRERERVRATAAEFKAGRDLQTRERRRRKKKHFSKQRLLLFSAHTKRRKKGHDDLPVGLAALAKFEWSSHARMQIRGPS